MRYAITEATAQQIMAMGGINVKAAPVIGVVFATLPVPAVKKLKELGYRVEPVGKVKATTAPPAVSPPSPVQATPTYSLEQLAFVSGLEDIRELFDPPLYGGGVIIAVIDSGIRETHDMLNDRVVYSVNFTTDPMRDGFNHGTAVASVIAKIAPECGILNLKVLDNNGEGTIEEVVLAIEECIELRQEQDEFAPAVINMSLGTEDDGNYYNPLRVACRVALAEGLYVYAAAGNFGPAPGTVMNPACERYVGAVGSIGPDPFIVSDFSSRGPTVEGLVKPDAVMFGEDIILASSGSDTATEAKSGTSFSVAFVSAITVIYAEGVRRRAITRGTWIELEAGEMFFVSQYELIDIYLPLICVKPSGEPSGQDYAYGYGMPYGPLVAPAMGLVPAVGIDMSSLITAMMTVMMMGMMMKSMA